MDENWIEVCVPMWNWNWVYLQIYITQLINIITQMHSLGLHAEPKKQTFETENLFVKEN